MSDVKEHIKTLLKLNIIATGILDVSNRFIFSMSGGKNMLKPGNGKYYKWKYGDVFYHKYGEGKPVVLLHDLDPSFSSYEWNEVVDELSKNNTVYMVDLPGCGRSDKPHIKYTSYYYVLFLKSFLRDVVKKECYIIASGYSSSVALIVSAEKNMGVKRITAVNPHSINDLSTPPGYKEIAASYLLRVPVIGTSVYNIIESRANIDYMFTEKYMYNPFRSKNRYVDAFYEGAHFGNAGGKYLLASVTGRKLVVDIRKAVHQTKTNIIIIQGGKQDNAGKISAQYKKLNNSVRTYIINQTKQLPHMENPDEFVSVCNES